MKKWNDERIQEALADAPGWSLNKKGQLEKLFQFKTFSSAILFVCAVAQRAEELAHHPDIHILFNKVTISVNTHDVGGITEKDFELAQEADSLKSH